MMAQRGPEHGPEILTSEQILGIAFDLDMTARHVFGWPYEEGIAAEYAKGGWADDSTYVELTIDAVYSKDLKIFIPDSAKLCYTEIVPRDLGLEDSSFAVPPPEYQLGEVSNYDLIFQKNKLTKSVNHVWYNPEKESWANSLKPPAAFKQVQGFAPSKLNQELLNTLTPKDLDHIYKVFCTFGFVGR
jgi:hypothetical protein